MGAASMSELVLAHWRANPDTVAPLRVGGIVRQDWLDGLLAGNRGAQPATLAFLVNVLVATSAAGSDLADTDHEFARNSA
jgi:asparagine synthase (glutamine-hydrolysing)